MTNARERTLKTHPGEADSDKDGLLDGEEANSSTAPDRNGDGVIDALQTNSVDSDGDCVVDAWDSQPNLPSTEELPKAAAFCDTGICEGNANVTVVCRPEVPTHARVVLGCLGCGCAFTTGAPATFEESETTCDGLDNDCDGRTDEGLDFDGEPLGRVCVAKHGVCNAPGPNGSATAGIVECSAAGKAVCSVGLGGSKTLAVPERCNGLDDDCDGQVDEGFSAGGKRVGQTCGPCGAALHVCDDGSIANAPEIKCGPAGDVARCSGMPFKNAFESLAAGGPPPQRESTIAFSPAWGQWLRYGGEVPVVGKVLTSDRLWRLSTTGTSQSAWQHASAQPPKARSGAAMAWDAAANRMLLLSGRLGSLPTTEVWALGQDGSWSHVSGENTKNTADFVPPTTASQLADHSLAVVVGNASGRHLVLFGRGRPQPFSTRLDGPANGRVWAKFTPPTSKPGHAALTGTVACVTGNPLDPREAFALVTGPIGTKIGVYRLRSDAGKLSISAIATQGTSPKRVGFSCALDNTGKLHVLGGHVPGSSPIPTGSYVHGQLSGTPAGATGLVWSQALNAPAEIVRDDAEMAWDPTTKSLLIGGGRRLVGGQPYAADDVRRWAAEASQATQINAATPAHRLGHATAFSRARGLCVAGGLAFGLPISNGTPAVMRPTNDVWCFGKSGWSMWTDKLKPFAFGAAAVDEPTGRLVLAGGLMLEPGQPVGDLQRLWQGKYAFGKGGSAPLVTAQVQSVHLQSANVVTHAKGPALAAMSHAHDKTGRRLLTFGGFNNETPTIEMWELQLGSMHWRQVSKGWVGVESPQSARPLPQYGGAMVWSSSQRTAILLPGVQFQHNIDKQTWSLTFQVLAPPPGGSLSIDECRGDKETLMWTIQPTSSPTILPARVATFADLETKPPQQPLFQPHFAQPSFLPVLFDSGSGHGLTLLPPVRAYAAKDEDGQPCSASVSPVWTSANRPLKIDLGTCGNAQKVFIEPETLQAIPDAFVLAGGDFDDTSGSGLLFGGLRPDGSPSNSLWSIDQECKAVVP